MDLYTVSGILSIYSLFVLSSGGRAEGQDEPCSARQQSEVQSAGRVCKDECQSTSDCRNPRECVCDGVCGLSCVNTGKENYCPSLDRLAGSQLISQESKSYGTIARYLCDPGYELLSGDLIRRCRGDRIWSGLPPNCAIPDCPIKEAEITDTDRLCMETCINDTDCAANQRCLCDDICGFTCILNTQVDYCEAIPEIDHVQTTYDRPSRIFGTVATFECEVGYTRQLGNPTWSRTCEGDRTWSGEDLICTKILSCPDPLQVPDAEIDESYESDLYVPGDLVYYRCNHGYYREGYAYIRCQDDETWTEPVIECRAKSCGLPPIPQNGAIDGAVYSYGTTIKTYCNPGYRLSGLPYRTCQGDQTWSGFDPSCIRIECPKLYPPANGMMEPEDRYTFETEVQITCDLGFVPDGDSRKSCLANRRWSGDGLRFACRDVNCGDPGTPDNGIKIGDSYSYNSVVFFECEDNFELSGSVSTVCNAEEQWTEGIPRCVGHCLLEEAQDHVSWSRGNLRAGKKIDDGVTLEWECDPTWWRSILYTYKKNSQEPWRCNNGVWSYQPQCLESPCSMLSNTSSTTYTFQPPIQPGNGVMVPSKRVATVRCRQGYQLTQLSSSPRCDRGNWKDLNSNPCRPEPCSILGVIDNGEVSYSQTTHSQTVVHNTVATYTCDDGYRMSTASSTNKCRFGQWASSRAPTCTPVPCDTLHIQRGTIEYNPPLSPNDSVVPSDTQATYQCNEGLQFEEPGTGIRQCERGTWTSLVPRCVEKPCAKFLEEPEDHWTITYSPTFSSNRASVSHEAVATLSCDNGYRGAVMLSTCHRGSWSSDLLPVCNPAPCTKFDDWQGTVNYSINTTNNKVPHRTNATFSNCGHGFSLSQNNSVLVCNLGDWHWETVCIRIPCESERADFAHGNITYRQDGVVIDVEQPHHGVQRDFVCDEGYTLLGNETSVCIAGRWMDMRPVCLANPCDPITPGNHVADVEYSSERTGDLIRYSDGTQATIVCDQQTAIVDESDGSVWCRAGVWEPNIPICGTHNLALRKVAYQSSTASQSPAGRAVDGNTISTSAGNSCTHTAPNNNKPWWYVDLGDQYNIDRINIVNYNDVAACPLCKRRLQGAVVRVSGSWNPSTLSDYRQCGNTVTFDQANSGEPIEFNCNHPTRGRYISVQLMRSGDVRLQLCEVQVFGSGPVQGCIVPAIPNGYVLNQQSVRYSPYKIVTSQQDYIYYQCDAGYRRQETSSYNTCREERDWAFQHSTCESTSCSIPQLQDNVVILTQGISQNIRVPHDTDVSFGCESNYNLEGRGENIRCSEGLWKYWNGSTWIIVNIGSLYCIATSCSIPLLQDHVIITAGITQNNLVSQNSYVTFGCDAGYTLEGGRSTRQCRQGGAWHDANIGSLHCTSSTPSASNSCQVLRLNHGSVRTPLTASHGTVISFTCHWGYMKNTHDEIRCQDGSLVPMKHACVKASCSIPQLQDNVVIRTQGISQNVPVPHSTDVSFGCESRYNFEGRREYIRCLQGSWKYWNGSTWIIVNIGSFSCTATSCSIPQLQDNVVILTQGISQNNRVPPGTDVSFGCESRYNLEGRREDIRCLQGSWKYWNGNTWIIVNIGSFSCTATHQSAPCSEPAATNNGIYELIEGTRYHENAVIQYTCDTGYTTNDVTISQCISEEWNNNPPPTCTVDPEYPSHGESCVIVTVRPDAKIFYQNREVYPPGVTSLPHNAVVLVSCLGENQHELQSTCVNGQWSIPLQSCDRLAYRSCQVPALPVGTITQNRGVVAPYTDLQHMSVVIINCDDGPFSSSRCNDGRWEVSLQSCVKTSCPRPPSTDTDLQQFINDTVNLEQDTSQEFPIGTYIISRCNDPGKKSLVPADSVRRKCTNRGWIGQQPTCESYGVKILIYGRNIRQLRNNGTLVIQAGLGTVAISCQSSNDYPVFFAPHITRVLQIAVNGKGSKRYRKYVLGTPQPQDSGLFSCRRYNSPVISFHIQVKDARCPDPGTPQNGHREGDDFNMNREVTFSCQEGYSLEGASSITCNVGEWSDSTPTCSFDQCPHYTLNENNVRELAGSGYHQGAIRIFHCSEGFTNANGQISVTSVCMDNGQWSPELLQCNVISQPDDPTTDDPCATKECEIWETCVDGTCYCLKPNLCPPAAADDLVCGSDNRAYDSVCHLKATACFFRRPITVEKIGEPCPEDFGSLSSSLSSSDGSPEDEASVPPEIVGDVSDPPIDDPPIDESVCADCATLSLGEACQRANYAFIGYIVDVNAESQEHQLNITDTYWGNIQRGITPIIPSVDNNCVCPRLNTTQDLLILTQSNHNEQILQLTSTDFVALAADYPIDLINGHETCRAKIR